MTTAKFYWFVALLAALCVAFYLTSAGSQHEPSVNPREKGAAHPNIIFILTDDMSTSDLDAMPNLKTLVTDQGVSFSHYFVTNSLCCPSRSSILRSQYTHNHGITRNQQGFRKFHDAGYERSTMATWLKTAGYTTALMGKYLNGYPDKAQPTYVAQGWDEWDAADHAGYMEYDYNLNENGKVIAYGESPNDYLTDVLARKAIAFIHNNATKKNPFFLYLATFAPHQPAIPALRHQKLFADRKAPRTASFNEKNVSTKPAFIRTKPPLNDKKLDLIDDLYRRRLQTLQAVDEMVAALVQTLKETGQLKNTYVVFTSDNGFHLGQHRLLDGKQTAYDEDIRVPLIIRGPGIPPGHVVSELALETDLGPTFADWASVDPPTFIDGRSLVPLLGSSPQPALSWRQGVLIEHTPGDEPFLSRFEKELIGGRQRLQGYAAVRSLDHLYVEYETGERELYDMRKDPAQLSNIYAHARPKLKRHLSSWLAELRSCAAAKCRTAENKPMPLYIPSLTGLESRHLGQTG